MDRRLFLLCAPSLAWASPRVENESSRHWHARVSTFARETVAPGAIVFLGDSMTERFPLQALLGHATPLALVNRGIGGDKVGGWRYWGLLDRLEAVQALRPAQVVLMIGVNDLVFANTPMDLLADALGNLLDRLRGDGIQLLVQAVLPVRGSLSVHQGRIDAYNAILSEAVSQRDLPWLDVRATFTDPSGLLRADLASDAVHLNATGYRLWAQALAPHLAT
jgi:lysophospholipase L1-like esterase